MFFVGPNLGAMGRDLDCKGCDSAQPEPAEVKNQEGPSGTPPCSQDRTLKEI